MGAGTYHTQVFFTLKGQEVSGVCTPRGGNLSMLSPTLCKEMISRRKQRIQT